MFMRDLAAAHLFDRPSQCREVHIGALLDGAHLLLIGAERFRQFLLRQFARLAHFLQRHFLGDSKVARPIFLRRDT